MRGVIFAHVFIELGPIRFLFIHSFFNLL